MPFKLNHFGALIGCCLILSSCETDESGMSLEEARQVSADFNAGSLNAPPRSSADILESIAFSSADRERIKDECSTLSSSIFSEEEAKEMWANLGNLKGGFAQGQAELHFKKGNIRRAIELMELALKNTSSSRDKSKIGAKLAMYNILVLDLNSAEKALQTAVSNHKSGSRGEKDTRFWIRLAQAQLFDAKGELKAGEGKIREAVDVAGARMVRGGSTYEYNSAGRYASSYLGLANNLLLQGKLFEAEVAIRDLLGLSSQVVPEARGRALEVLSRILLEQGRYSDAEDVVRVALNEFSIGCTTDQNFGRISATETMGKVLVLSEKWSEADSFFDASAKATENERQTFGRLFEDNTFRALSLLQAKRWQDADTLLRRSVVSVGERLGQDHYRLVELNGMQAVALAGLGQKDAAAELFSKVISKLINNEDGEEIESLGQAVRLQTRKLILNSYLGLMLEETNNPHDSESGRHIIAEGFELAGVIRGGAVARDLALSAVRSALDDPELSNIIRSEQDLKKRISGLKALLRRSLALSSDQVDQNVVKDIETEIDRLKVARTVINSEIETRFPKYASLTKPKPVSIEEAQATLNPDATLLVIHVAANRTYIWAVPKDTPVVFASVDTDPAVLEDQVAGLRAAVDPGPLRSLGDIPEFNVSLAHELYKTLLEPVKSGWQDAKELVVVADGPLGSLPFSLLVSKQGVAQKDTRILFDRYRTVSWMARNLAVTSLPSVDALKSLRAIKASSSTDRRPFIGFGDPFFSVDQAAQAETEANIQLASRGISLRSAPRTRAVSSASLAMLPRLPETRDEVNAVGSALGADPAEDIYLGERASEKEVKNTNLSRYEVILFATHGLVPGDLDGLDQPALALSSPEVTNDTNDGLLTMDEILGLKLNADFAVLSACNTAAADGSGAEILSGLGRAFFYAGTRALLVSNWPVHSAATTDLMRDIFASLANDKTLTRTEALRRSKIRQIEEGGYEIDGTMAFSYAHPIFWAPFTIVGDGGRTLSSYE